MCKGELTATVPQGITFNLIIIRVHKGAAPSVAGSVSGSAGPHHSVQFAHSSSLLSSSSSGPFPTVETEVDVQLEIDADQIKGREGRVHKAPGEPSWDLESAQKS